MMGWQKSDKIFSMHHSMVFYFIEVCFVM